MTRFVPSWSTVLATSLATALTSSRLSSPSLKILKRFIVFVLLLNWRGLPFVWHIGECSHIPSLWTLRGRVAPSFVTADEL